MRYGISDGDPYAPALTCGGSVDVFASQVSAETFPGLDAVARDLHANRPVAVATILEHPDAAVVGRRLVVRPRPGGRVPPELASAGSTGSQQEGSSTL